MEPHHIWTRLAGALGGLLLTVFGGYLLYEKVGLSLLDGQTEERVGTVFRASEPAIFWTSVLSNGVFGILLAGAGLFVLGLALTPRR